MNSDSSRPHATEASTVQHWVQRLADPLMRWWDERPARCTWDAFVAAAGPRLRKPPAMNHPDALRTGDDLHPMVARAMVLPEGLDDALTTLPWTVLYAPQSFWSSRSSTFRHSSPALEVVLPLLPEASVSLLAQRALDDAAKVFNDPTFQFQDKDLPLNDRGHLPTSMGEAHRPAWRLLQHQRVRRTLFALAQGLVARDTGPDEATVARWQRWATVLACTTYSQAEALVVTALVQYGHAVPMRTVTPTSVLRRVPDMPVGFFASARAQGLNLEACQGYYQPIAGGKWKSTPEAAVLHGRSGGSQRALRFNLLDLAALRGRDDLVSWCLDQGLRPNPGLIDPLLTQLRQALDDASPSQREQAAVRLQSVEALALRAATIETSAKPLDEPSSTGARRRL